MLLSAIRFNVLLKIPPPVQRPDADEWQAEVAGRFTVIAGQNAETARVRPQALVKAKLAREIGKRPAVVVGMIFSKPGSAGGLHVRVEFPEHGLVHREEHVVLKQRFPVVRLDIDEEFDRVAIHRPQGGLDVGKHPPGMRIPRPPQIVGQIAEPGNFARQFDVRQWSGPEF